MKLAVISDIHGNLEALKTVLHYLKSENITNIICLGDVVGYGPRPNECTELVKKHCLKCLMGNHDHAVLGLTEVQYFNQYAKDAVLWSRRELSHLNKAYLDNLPFIFEDTSLIFVHSSPIEPMEWHYILSEKDARQNFDSTPHQLTFIGHSHIPQVYSFKAGQCWQPQIQITPDDRFIVNVGSVGQPRDGDPRACFVIYDDDAHTLEYIRLQYDIDITAQEILDHNLPRFLAMRLYAGQ